MKKMLIGITVFTLTALLVKRLIDTNTETSGSERANETLCPYLIEPEGGKHRVYFSS